MESLQRQNYYRHCSQAFDTQQRRRLIVLDKGRLAEFGTHNELMRAKGVYYKLVMAQRQTTKMKKAALPQTASEA